MHSSKFPALESNLPVSRASSKPANVNCHPPPFLCLRCLLSDRSDLSWSSFVTASRNRCHNHPVGPVDENSQNRTMKAGHSQLLNVHWVFGVLAVVQLNSNIWYCKPVKKYTLNKWSFNIPWLNGLTLAWFWKITWNWRKPIDKSQTAGWPAASSYAPQPLMFRLLWILQHQAMSELLLHVQLRFPSIIHSENFRRSNCQNSWARYKLLQLRAAFTFACKGYTVRREIHEYRRTRKWILEI